MWKIVKPRNLFYLFSLSFNSHTYLIDNDYQIHLVMILLWVVTKNGLLWFVQIPFHWERCTLSRAQTEDGRSKTFKSPKSLSRLNLKSNFLQLISFKRDLHWILPSSRLMKWCFIRLKRVFSNSNQWKQRSKVIAFTDIYQIYLFNNLNELSRKCEVTKKYLFVLDRRTRIDQVWKAIKKLCETTINFLI